MPEQSFFSRLRDDPAVKGLIGNIGSFATAKVEDMAKGKSEESSSADDGEGVVEAGKKEAKRRAIIPAIKGFFSGAWNKLTKGSKGGKRPHNVLETAIVGAPVEMVWDQWLDFESWPSFMKGPESVKQEKEGEGDDGAVTNWTAKVFIHRRQWKSTITEQVDYERLRWKSEAAKGTVDGVVSFAPAGENLTFVVLVLEYRPKGFFEKIGSTWRVAGRRARLDFKHFQRHIAMADQAESLKPPEESDEQRAGDGETGDGDAGDTGTTTDTGGTEGTGGTGDIGESETDEEGAESVPSA